MKNMNSIIKSIGFILLTILMVTACNPGAQDQAQPDPFDQTTSFDQANPNTQVYPYDQNPTGNQVGFGEGIIPPFDRGEPRRERNTQRLGEGTVNDEIPDRNNEAQEAADRLVSLANGVEEVNDATAVVVGRWAIVGIDVNAQLDRSKVGSIKYTVAEAIKDDPKGAYAIVTADIDTNYRLKQMAKEIREGRPIAGVMDELAAIVGRLMPQVPRHVQDPKSPQEREEQGAGTEPPVNP